MEWISVKDRLPHEDVNVLCVDQNENDQYIKIGHFSLNFENIYWTDDNSCSLEKVTHWMPLPELPSVWGNDKE